MGPKQVLFLQVKGDFRVMAMKKYFPLHRSSELKPHNQMHFGIIPRTRCPVEHDVIFERKGF